MKRILLLSSLFLTLSISAQLVSDQVTLGPGYTNQSFYSLMNGEVANVNNTDWDIAILADGFGSSLLINDNNGTGLYLYGDVSEWAAVDTTDMGSWDPLLNSDSDWEKGAFIAPQDPAAQFDYGWGIYNPVTHIVSGDRLYVITLANGDVKKLKIDALNFGSYSFTYADLDGSNELTESVNVASYPDRNFFYYSFSAGEFADREPAISDWDITFTRFVEDLPFIGNYLVTGALTNPEAMSGEARNVVVDDAVWTDYPFISDISEIGSDWKMFDQTIFQYIIEDDLTYFVQDVEGNVWRVIFTGFGGSATGAIEFDKEMLSVVGLEEDAAIRFEMYPNPAETTVNLVFPLTNELATLSIIDMQGRTVRTKNVANGLQHIMDVNGLHAGVYIVSLQVAGQIAQQPLVIR